jgi:hypothetical protein
MALLTVGIGKQFSTIPAAINAAQSGDTIQVDAGTYANQYAHITKDLTLTGVGGRVEMTSTGLIPNGKGILITDANVTINNFDFSGAKVADHNGAGIRDQSGNLTLNNDGFFNNEMGVMTGNSGRGSVTVNNSEFGDNGTIAAGSIGHGLYVGRIQNLTVNNSYFHGDIKGHEIKSRADNNVIENSRVYDFNSTAGYTIDLPEGGNALIKNNVIEQGPNSPNYTIISYGEEGNLNPGTNFVVNNNTIINDIAGHGTGVRNATSVTAHISNNEIFGLTGSRIAAGPNTQSDNTLLATRPILDTSHPWAAATAPPPTTDPPSSDTSLSIKILSDTGASATDHITSTAAVGGAGDLDLPVTIKEGSSLLATVSTGDDGMWTYTPNLTDGAHTLTVSQGSDTASLGLILDTKPPAVAMALFLDTGASATDNITLYPALKGTGQASTAVTLKEGDTILGTTMADINGNWTFMPHVGAGTHTLTASQTDLAGNTGSAALTFELEASSLYGAPQNNGQ